MLNDVEKKTHPGERHNKLIIIDIIFNIFIRRFTNAALCGIIICNCYGLKAVGFQKQHMRVGIDREVTK